MASGLETFLERVFSVPGNVVLGLVFLFVVIFLRRVQVSGNKDFNKMFEARQPSLQAGPSGFDLVTRGTLGCVQAVIAFILLIVFFLLALDAILNKSDGLMRLITDGF